jgi:hypothetical protein
MPPLSPLPTSKKPEIIKREKVDMKNIYIEEKLNDKNYYGINQFENDIIIKPNSK